MENFLGTWKLEKNENFGEFLIYYGYGWVKRQFALQSNIDLTLKKLDDNKLLRIIDSTFLTASEEYIFDDNFRTNDTGLEKSHQFVNNEILSEVKNEKYHWNEINKIENGKLIINRYWKENGIEKKCRQIFIKY